ncbi:hypothetical protein GF382_00130 [Candidatus Falkowbacteria bacterium]|nr:hypothetical protein [Candidatus Falkowbacteria bacterium]
MKIWITNFLKEHWRGVVVGLLAVGFFALVSSLNYSGHGEFVKWSSPDETANYVFTKLYGQSGQISFFEKYNLYADEVMHPRSMRSDIGTIKPVSFLGIILIYGKIVSLTSYKIIPYLTPFFGAVGIVFFYLLIRKIFGKTNALLSAVLLAGFPVWIYYSVRSMFHNVLFVSLLMIGLYFLLKMADKKFKAGFFSWKADWLGMLYASLAGIFIGLASITRTSELLWILPMLFILWILNLKKTGLIKLFIFLSFTFLALMPALFWNQILYGSPISGGYAEMNQSIHSIREASSDLVKATVAYEPSYIKYLVGRIKENVFFFGFKPEQSMKMFYHYFAGMFTWFFIPACLGLFLYLQRIYKWKKAIWVFFLAYAVISVILVFYYGSWKFNDNPDLSSHTIGNSYTRYWLPMYLGSFPLISFFLIIFTYSIIPEESEVFQEEKRPWWKKFLKRPRRKVMTLGTRALIVGIFFILSANFVFLGSEEGIVYSRANSRYSTVQLERILDWTESNSVVITQYHDKLVFPERKVIVGTLTDDNMNMIYSRLIDYLPVYYYSFTFPTKDFDYLNNKKLKEFGIRLERVKKITEDFTLYRLYRPSETLEE